jgi:hypothetical protein
MAKKFNTYSGIQTIAWIAHMSLGSEVLVGMGSSMFAAKEDLGAAVFAAIGRLRVRGESLPCEGEVVYKNVEAVLMVGDGGPYLEFLMNAPGTEGNLLIRNEY